MIIWNKYYHFIFGLTLTSASIDICLGWVGATWSWRKVNILDSFPMMNMGPCNKCGATDWTGANPTEDGNGFKDCNKCTDYPDGPQ